MTFHEFSMQCGQFGERIVENRPKRKLHISIYVEIAVDILLVELVVTRRVFVRVDKLLADEEFTPGMIAVAAEQGVVQIEDR